MAMVPKETSFVCCVSWRDPRNSLGSRKPQLRSLDDHHADALKERTLGAKLLLSFVRSALGWLHSAALGLFITPTRSGSDLERARTACLAS